MEDLTFGEQVKIILGRKGMTIKHLAELIENRTGKKMSRQNLTQRLGRDNFQEQDMRMIAQILDCPFHLSIMSEVPVQPRSTAALEMAAIERTEAAERKYPESGEAKNDGDSEERDMTIGELYDMHKELSELEENVKAGEPAEKIKEEIESSPEPEQTTQTEQPLKEEKEDKAEEKKTDFEPVISHDDAQEDRQVGEINPYTGMEYQSNSVRMHPTRIGYVQVYDRTIHKWTDMTEWAFLGLQERKKALFGSAYEPPIYLD